MRKFAFWLSLILIFIIPWENVVVLPGVGTASKTAGLAIAGFWGLTVLFTGSLRKLRGFHLLLFIYILWHVLSSFWSLDRQATLTRSITYFQLVIMILLIWDLFTTPAALKAGLQAYVLGAYVAIGSTIINYLTSGGHQNGELTYQRYSATGFNANALALILALGIPLAWHLAVSEGSGKMARLLRPVNFAYMPAAVLAVLLTASRTGLVVTLVASLFILGSLMRLQVIWRILIFAALAGVLWFLPTFVPQSSLERLASTRASLLAGSLGGREYIWREGLEIFYQYPLGGVGSNAFAAAVGSNRVAHNAYLSVLTEVGLIGFALFALILLVAGYNALAHPRWEARLWLTVLLVWALGMTTLTWEHRKQTWLFLSLVVVSANVSPGNVKRTERRPNFPDTRTPQSAHLFEKKNPEVLSDYGQ